VKIWIISQYFYPENFAINQIAAELCKRGHDVTVLSGMPNYPSGRFAPGYGGWRIRRETYHGVSVIRVPMIARGRGTRRMLALNYLSYALVATTAAPFLLRGRADVVFVYQPSPLTVALPALMTRLIKKTPVVLWIQDLWPESLVAAGALTSAAALKPIRWLARFIYRRCALILVQSPGFIEHVRALTPPAIAIRYFPNSADSHYFPIEPPADLGAQPMLPRGFRVLFAGSIGAAQDFGTLLAAAERLREVPEIKWVVMGEGRRKRWLADEIVARKLQDTVQLIEQQPSERMPYYFAQADGLLVMLSRSAVSALTIPSKLQAYLASGRPVIAAIDGEGARIVRESQAGLACGAGEPAALAAAVLALYNMTPAERERMGAAGRRYFEQEFQRGPLMDQLIGWLSELK
jgi:colanic acid biosynthesis glycosyl transferase WcaI